MSMSISVSVVIAAYNQKELLSSCVRALLEQDLRRQDAFEIIVADDGSADGTREYLEKSFSKNIKYLRQANNGPASARNLGIKNSSGSIVAFTDADCRPDKAWLSSALKHFEDETISGVEGRTVLMNPENNTPFSHFTENLTGGRYLTCNIFYRRSVLEKAGGFDERFKLAIREDTDLAFTVLEAGGKIVFSPQTIIRHPVSGPDYGRFFKKAKEAYYDALLYKKHPRLYRKKLKWYDGWAIPVFYYGYYVALAAAIVGFREIGSHYKFPLMLAGISHVLTLVHACRKKKTGLKHIIIMFFQFLIIPFIRLYWVKKGNLKFRTLVF